MFLKGKEVAETFYESIREQLSPSSASPGIAFVLVGEDPASSTYVNMKQKKCHDLGFNSEILRYPHDTTTETLSAKIEELSRSPDIDGILVQQPLPAHIDQKALLYAIPPEKDVDGFHPLNIGKMTLGDPSGFIPCTPLGIIQMLRYYHLPLEGKHVTICGRSPIVGRPLSILLSQNHQDLNATVSLCHSRTQDVSSYTQKADILIAAIGSPKAITAEMVKPGAIVIDVGISRISTDEGKTQLVGDVDFDHVAEKVSYITPVPGGVGPMTIAMLMHNTFTSFQRRL